MTTTTLYFICVLCVDIFLLELYIFLWLMILIYFMAMQNGIMTKCINNKIIEKLRNINLEFFMTHMILISYIPDFIWYKFVPNKVEFNILLVIILFVMSICFSFLLKHINNNFKKHKKMKGDRIWKMITKKNIKNG